MDIDEEIARLSAQREQRRSGLREIAETAHDYLDALTAEGFARVEAIPMVQDFLGAMMDSCGDEDQDDVE